MDLIELQLSDAVGTLLTERIHVFGMAGGNGPLGGLLRNKELDKSDNTPDTLPQFEGPDSPNNLAYVGNGASPAVASSELEVQTIDETDYIHTATGLNDGQYGNQGSWIATEPKSFFTIDLGKSSMIGQFKLGRDRSGVFHANRTLGYLKIETSENGETWQAVFEKTRNSGPNRLYSRSDDGDSHQTDSGRVCPGDGCPERRSI